MTELSSKKVGESVTVTVDFTLLTPNPTSPEFLVKHLRGVADPTPSAMVGTAPFITSSTLVSCLISGGVVGATYALEVWVNAGAQRLCETLEMTVTA